MRNCLDLAMLRNNIIALFIFIFAVAGYGQDSVSVSLKHEWYYYDQIKETLLPFVNGVSSKVNIIHLTIDPSQYKNSVLDISARYGTSVFINNRMNYYFSQEKRHTLELSKYLKDEVLKITLYNPSGVAESETRLVQALPIQTFNKTINEVKKRNRTQFNNVLLTAVMTILALYGYSKVKDTDLFKSHFKWERAVSVRNINETLYKTRVLERANLLLLIAHSLGIGLAVFGMIYFFELSDKFGSPLVINEFWRGLSHWLKLSGLIFMALMGKNILITSFAGLFKLNVFRKVHFFNYLRLSILIYAMLLLLLLCNAYVFPGDDLFPIILNIGLLLMLLRGIIIFIKLLNLRTHRFLHLFSYICATEIIPYILLVKITYL